MKLIRTVLLTAAAGLLVSCFGKEEKPAAAAAPAKPAAPSKPTATHNPRPNRPPPPPQPQDGSMIVRPGGTKPLLREIEEIPELDGVSDADKKDAFSAAETEITRRKKDAAEGDDAVSKALRDISKEDLGRAFTELKKATGRYPKAAE